VVKVSVGLMEGRNTIEVELLGRFRDSSGKLSEPGKYQFASETTLTPATSIGSRAQPNRILGIIARPHSKSRPECVRSVAKLWRGRSCALHANVMAGHSALSRQMTRPSTPPWGWRRKTWMPGREDAIRAPGHDDWNRSA